MIRFWLYIDTTLYSHGDGNKMIQIVKSYLQFLYTCITKCGPWKFGWTKVRVPAEHHQNVINSGGHKQINLPYIAYLNMMFMCFAIFNISMFCWRRGATFQDMTGCDKCFLCTVCSCLMLITSSQTHDQVKLVNLVKHPKQLLIYAGEEFH